MLTGAPSGCRTGLRSSRSRPAEDCILASLQLGDLRDFQICRHAGPRRLLDLDADPEATDQPPWSRTEVPAPLVRSAPGCRAPWARSTSPEMAVRAVLGQQVSTAAASHPRRTARRRLRGPWKRPSGRLVVGPSQARSPWPRLCQRRLSSGSPRCSAGPLARQATFAGLVTSLADGKIDLGPGPRLGRGSRPVGPARRAAGRWRSLRCACPATPTPFP